MSSPPTAPRWLYLSAARNHTLQEELLAGGYAPDTPVIIGHQVTWPDEVMVRCRLDQLAATMKSTSSGSTP